MLLIVVLMDWHKAVQAVHIDNRSKLMVTGGHSATRGAIATVAVHASAGCFVALQKRTQYEGFNCMWHRRLDILDFDAWETVHTCLRPACGARLFFHGGFR